MSSTETDHPKSAARVRPLWLWIATALAFPPSGYLGHLLAGPVDAVGAALLGGLITGLGIGTAQWAVLRRRGASPAWIPATAAGLALGLAAGSALVDYQTSLGDLALMGAVSGLAVGAAQAAVFAPLRRRAAVWTMGVAALWALGWAVTTAAGIDVEEQYTVFGATGALAVALLQSVLVGALVPPAAAAEAVDHA